MLWRILTAALVLGGCGDNIAEPGDGDGDGDGDADASVDAGCESFFAPDHVDPCELPETPEPAILIPTGEEWNYNTTTGTLTDDGGAMTTPVNLMVALDPPVRVLWTESLTIETGGTLVVDGDHPLIIGAASTVAIAGLLDLTAKNEDPRAGSNPAACPTSPPDAGTTDALGSGGGGAGAFQGAGAAGGDGNTAAVPAAGGAGGVALASVPATPRGGCPGAAGGDGNGGEAGDGGTGGGAVQISAAETITLSAGGAVNAGGGGGVGATGGQGAGGGAGAGGYVRLEAATISIDGAAAVTANGGGGGGGSNNVAATDGGDGRPDLQGGDPGGGNGGAGADGGRGGDAGNIAGDSPSGTAQGGGGGGGGGGGFVILPQAVIDAAVGIISPTPLPEP